MYPIPVFFGHDTRLVAGTTVFLESVIRHARRPIALVPITKLMSPDFREGTNSFTYRRFLVPWIMGWKGTAIFVDGADMVCRDDITELMEHYDPYMAVQVVKHDYKTKHLRKYCGTGMEADNDDYARKNWCSVMIINCAHYAWRRTLPDFVNKVKPLELLQLRFIDDNYIGDLPAAYNWLVDEMGANNDAKLLHFTAGIPGIFHYSQAPMAHEWHDALQRSQQVDL